MSPLRWTNSVGFSLGLHAAELVAEYEGLAANPARMGLFYKESGESAEGEGNRRLMPSLSNLTLKLIRRPTGASANFM